MTAFIKKISGREMLNDRISRAPGTMLRLVSLAINTDTQDLLPSVLALTIDSGWALSLELRPTEELEPIASMILTAMSWMICPPHRQRYKLTLATQRGLIRSIRNDELVDWIAHVITRLGLSYSARENRDIS
ncbi:unnamed protein product [Rhizoctonia solani]|uniref:Uncharacterized protein n=1 Tax=Rhizoctonia solani TaxID=456999 RepID=A0A8H3CEC1_9AGAM|nr:unnamed protein product [Rhizoctonia solani]